MVVMRPSTDRCEPERLVQLLRGEIRFTHLEKRRHHATPLKILEHATHQRRADPATPRCQHHAEVENLSLIDDRTSDDVTRRRAAVLGDEDRPAEAEAIGEIAARPRIGESDPLDRD